MTVEPLMLVVLILMGVVTGFGAGLTSKLIMKRSFEKWIKDKMVQLEELYNEQLKRTQEDCNLLIQKAQHEIISMYNEAHKNTRSGVKTSSLN